jgi:regulator of extracellular matrix RemA (YlzA/DUF370 family)
MANYYGVNKTKALTPTSGNILDPGQLAGKVRVMTDTYEAAAIAAGSVIYMGDSLPIGARILDVVLAFDALGSATISVGDSTSAARYLDALSVASAGIKGMIEDDNVDGLLYEITSTTRDIILTTASASITGTIKLIVKYTCE